jgi:hypothetical protein
MKFLLNILLAAAPTGLAYSIAELPFTAVGVFNFGFVTALVAWTLAQYEPRKRPLWMLKRTALMNDPTARTKVRPYRPAGPRPAELSIGAD